METALSMSAFGVAVIVGMLLGYVCFARGKDNEIKDLKEKLKKETIRADESQKDQTNMIGQVSSILISLGTIGEKMKSSEGLNAEELLKELGDAVESTTAESDIAMLEGPARNEDTLDDVEQNLTIDEFVEAEEELNNPESPDVELLADQEIDNADDTKQSEEPSETNEQPNEEGKK